MTTSAWCCSQIVKIRDVEYEMETIWARSGWSTTGPIPASRSSRARCRIAGNGGQLGIYVPITGCTFDETYWMRIGYGRQNGFNWNSAWVDSNN